MRNNNSDEVDDELPQTHREESGSLFDEIKETPINGRRRGQSQEEAKRELGFWLKRMTLNDRRRVANVHITDEQLSFFGDSGVTPKGEEVYLVLLHAQDCQACRKKLVESKGEEVNSRIDVVGKY